MINTIQQDVDDEIIKGEGEINKTQYRNIVSKTISMFYKFLKDNKKVTSLPESHHNDIVSKYKQQIEDVKAETFNKLPIKISKTLDDKLTEICGELFTRESNLARGSSGIVIAGFGEEEFFPSVVSYFIEGVANDRLKYYQTDKVEVTTSMTAAIIPFAQREMVNTFVEGVNPTYTNYLHQYLMGLFDSFPNTILNQITELTAQQKAKYSKRIKKYGERLFSDFSQSMVDYRREEFVSPIVDAVAVLPKEELAVLAESLVNITALKQKMSMSHETVGGFIDVAVISKGDGFVWIKQKQYSNLQ